MTTGEHRIVSAVLSGYAEEAAPQWLLRDAAVRAPHYSLRTLSLLESRLDGYLDGLRIGGDAGWAMLRDELNWRAPGAVFAAGVLAFESNNPKRLADVLPVATLIPELARALASALGWLPWNVVWSHAEELLCAETPHARRAGVAAHAIHRMDPKHLERLLEDDSPLVCARALRAIGELGRKDLHPAAKSTLWEADAICRFWGASSVTLLGDGIAVEELRSTAEGGGPLAQRAALLVARAMNQCDALTWQRALAGDKQHLRLAVTVAGAIGNPALVPWLLDQMGKPHVARVAGEAFTTITGIDLAYHDLEGKWPEGFEAGPNDNPEDENVSMDPDENLPFPDSRLVSEWWARNGRSLQPGVRYLAGKPITPRALEDVLRKGRQRVRAAAALELTLLQPGRPLFEVRAPAARQRALLGL